MSWIRFYCGSLLNESEMNLGAENIKHQCSDVA